MDVEFLLKSFLIQDTVYLDQFEVYRCLLTSINSDAVRASVPSPYSAHQELASNWRLETETGAIQCCPSDTLR